MLEIKLKPVDVELLPELMAIYNYYVLNTTVTFHTKAIDLNGMREILFDDDPRFLSYAIMNQDDLCGYCILAHYKKREAYDCTAEVTIYLKHGYERRGIATLAIRQLEEIAVRNGFHALVTIICGENIESIGFFASLGYQKCAHYREVGTKFGRLLDIVSFQKILQAERK